MMRKNFKIKLTAGYWLLAVMPARLRFVLLMAGGLSGVEASFAQINSDSLISVYTQKMHKYLDKENKASEVFSFTKEGIEVYAPETDTSTKKSEYFIGWKEITTFKDILDKSSQEELLRLYKQGTVSADWVFLGGLPVVYAQDLSKPLLQYKIALDPGHIAGDLETAKMEKKWVEMKNMQPTPTLPKGGRWM
jgi:hypothetical protein